MKQFIELFRQTFSLAMLAGLCISMAGTVYLRVGGIGGACLFAFGLMTVVYYGLKLYTGTAGFIRRSGDWTMLCLVLIGNIVGCWLTALAVRYALPDVIEPATQILEGRLAKGPWACFLLAVGCGFIMTTAVNFGRQGKYLAGPDILAPADRGEGGEHDGKDYGERSHAGIIPLIPAPLSKYQSSRERDFQARAESRA